jgi:CheY-like chemotaxis protein
MALEERAASPLLTENLEEIQKAAQRSADLTRQLLTFARKQPFSPKILDLNEAVGGMLKILRRLIREDIELVWLPGGHLWPVRLDPSQLDQILANLTVNAGDAIRGIGRITIEAANVVLDPDHIQSGGCPGDYVQVTISDNGAGMSREVQEHLFEPFFTTKGLGEGTGLGLATVYGIVKQNRGMITCYSELGKGSTFKIYLPRAGEVKTPTAKPGEEKLLEGSETILLVEDEPAILKLGTRLLERLGYHVLPANEPAEALRLAEEHAGKIHLLISDVVMPAMNGRDLADLLTSRNPGLKCLFISGYTASVIAQHGVLEAGFHFVQKPFSTQDLARKVRDALHSPTLE